MLMNTRLDPEMSQAMSTHSIEEEAMKIARLSAAAILLSSAAVVAEEQSQMTQTTEPQSQMAQPAEQIAPPTMGEVARAVFSQEIQDREPADTITQLNNDQNKIYYFTELKGLSGQTVTHRWEYNGQVMAEVPFEIGGDRWRVYSSKTLDPVWIGQWKASVVDQSGATLSVNTFSYDSAPKQPEESPPPAPAAQQ
jgi:hypothetical protein